MAKINWVNTASTTITNPSIVGAFEAKTHLSALLARVEAGETITITNRGRAVAKLIPLDSTDDQGELPPGFWERIDARSAQVRARGWNPTQDEIGAMITEGRT